MTAQDTSENRILTKRKISNWTNTNLSCSYLFYPKNIEDIFSVVEYANSNGKSIICRGAGQSYSDQSLNNHSIVVDMANMDEILNWDKASGLIKVEPGINYEKIISHCVVDGWLPAVIPGTRYVTMGGALSNNVHGKNSYSNANFGNWVREFKIIVASGEIYTCSNEVNQDLYFAVIGGSGLFGVVIEITIQLIKVPSAFLRVQKIALSSLSNLIDKLDELSKKNDFAVAQVDCFPKNKKLGRGTIHVGSFLDKNIEGKNIEIMRQISPKIFGIFPKKIIPIIGRYLVNDYTMRLVSLLKYYIDKNFSSEYFNEDIFHFTFLLDQVPNWKRIFRYGFFEYEPLIPRARAKDVIAKIISLTHKYKMPAYLSAIKIHQKDDFLISYSMDGYSFAIDIPKRPKDKKKQDELFREMNKLVIEVGGIIYLAKDVNLTSDEFKKMYKNFDKFLAVKKKYDPNDIFQSDMYRRIFENKK